jgi:hypothetical protein
MEFEQRSRRLLCMIFLTHKNAAVERVAKYMGFALNEGYSVQTVFVMLDVSPIRDVTSLKSQIIK